MGGRKRFLLASTSQQKLSALQAVVARMFPDCEAVIEGIKSYSGVDEQPVGSDTLIGAVTRLSQLSADDPGDIRVAIESGIFSTADGGWEDKAYVVVQQGDLIVAQLSRGVLFPTEAVDEANKRGFGTTTVGAILAEWYNCDPADPQSYLTSGYFPRQMQLEEALEVAFKHLLCVK